MPVFIAELFTIAKLWSQPRCQPTDEWIKKMEYYSAIKKYDIMLFARKWMELEITMLSKINQTQKKRYHMFSFICGI
jgi:hypothetical protein